MVATVAGVYRDLPAEEQAESCVFTGNYGEAGAVDFFGPRYDLPRAISGHNNYYIWGPRGCTGKVLISVGVPLGHLEAVCSRTSSRGMRSAASTACRTRTIYRSTSAATRSCRSKKRGRASSTTTEAAWPACTRRSRTTICRQDGPQSATQAPPTPSLIERLRESAALLKAESRPQGRHTAQDHLEDARRKPLPASKYPPGPDRVPGSACAREGYTGRAGTAKAAFYRCQGAPYRPCPTP